MKKIIAASMFLALLAFSAGAQTMYDAMNFSQNNYYGTARSMALGNAVTAVGGDLGMVGINPAGSAVSPYGIFTVTPGVTISSVSSSYSDNGTANYASPSMTGHARMNMPNIGMSIVFDTGASTGLTALTFSFLSNQTNNFNYSANAFGTNSRTSKLAELASAASGLSEDVLSSYNSFNNSDVSWDILSGYQGGMFGSYGTDGQYVATSEALGPGSAFHYVPGALAQTSETYKYGSKNDLVFNFGFNYSDQLYLGVNVGVPSMRYNYIENFYEAAVNPEQFPLVFEGDNGSLQTTNFSDASYSYHYAADIDGMYLKFGGIYRVGNHLRVGAAFQTPSILTVSETWQYSAGTSFTDSSFDDYESSPAGEYSYNLSTPYLFNVGVAYTFGTSAMVSMDYELTDYSVMKVHELDYAYNTYDAFEELNATNKNFAGVSHMLRIGAEYKLNPMVTLRAGCTLLTDPEKYWTNNIGEEVTADDYYYDYRTYSSRKYSLVTPHHYKDVTRSFSIGAGYSSPGSFFADVAVRLMSYPNSVYSPYYDYDACDANGNYLNVQSPRISNDRNLWDAALTLGWRF